MSTDLGNLGFEVVFGHLARMKKRGIIVHASDEP